MSWFHTLLHQKPSLSALFWQRSGLTFLGLAGGVLLVTLLRLKAPPVYAGGTVATCNETSLLTALNHGEIVSFDCSRITALTPMTVAKLQANFNLYLPLLMRIVPAPKITSSAGDPLPTFSKGVANRQTNQSVSLTDTNSPADELQLAVTSSNSAVLPMSGILVQKISAGNFNVRMTPSAVGETQLIYTATSSIGGQAIHTLSLTVVATNTRPLITVAVSDQSTPGGTLTTVNFTASDPDGDPLTFSASGAGAGAVYQFSGSGENRALHLTPSTVVKSSKVSIQVTDGWDNGIAVFNLHVTTPGGSVLPPVFKYFSGDYSRAVLVNTKAMHLITLIDPDSPLGLLTLSATSSNPTVLPDTAVAVERGNTFGDYKVVFTLTVTGETTLRLTATDESGKQTTQNMNLKVKVANTPPTISAIPDQTTSVGTPLTVNFTVSDPDGDTVNLEEADYLNPNIATYSFGGSGDNRTITFTPIITGTATVSIHASDGIGFANDSFTLTVTP